jgi:hypothetical protein
MAGGGEWRLIRRWLTGLVAAVVGWAVLAGPVLAHGLGDGDPAHLLEDLLLSFGLPLVVLAVGALVGVALSKWLARHGDAGDNPDDRDGEPVQHDEPVGQREQ